TISHTCPHCGSNNTSDVKISKGIKIENFNGDRLKVLDKESDITLPISNWKIKIKVPTLQKVMDISQDYTKDTEDLENYLLYITSLTINESILTNKSDIITYFKLLPSKDRKVIDEEIRKLEKENGSVNVSFRIVCKNCGGKYSTNVNFVEQLFRSL
ncbi:MAG: hypothetical protein QW478_10470, partial [Candidatus Micrarchaeaceae archaeon]